MVISQDEKYFSDRLCGVALDGVALTLIQRVKKLMAARPDMKPKDFGRAIGRTTPSWVSEFFNEKRTTNDLRLVIRIAKVFAVPVGYLLNEADEPEADAQTLTLLGAFRTMEQVDREIVLRMAVGLARRNGGGDDAPPPPSGTGGAGGAPHTPPGPRKPRPRKHR